MRIAVAQVTTGAEVQQNLDLIAEWTADAAAQGAELVVFPEAAQRAFGNPLKEIAEPLDGWFAQQVEKIAEEHGVLVVVGMFTPGQPSEEGAERVTNTLLISDGEQLKVSYDKIHLYDAFGFQESKTVQPGAEPVTVKVSGATVGFATCYDVRFPHLFQHYARRGASATILPASWQSGPGKVAQWKTLVTARALDSTQFIIACGQALPNGTDPEKPASAPTGVGHSLVVSPTGSVIAEAGEGPELLIVDIDPADVQEARKRIPVLENARDLR
ncbi:carbon-nitrogen hydrolase family protein [Nesterenkonia sp. NBAIMH1]|uniref:carbon-nitrogen hydrolase family protein n=1 Tax=Nesterenkonia sp. NBAIMH1 TaxID=2600320 RepID=UPI0011B513C4|nr:carbon-nitrogen hydrolase family protein [Nesterenkonia sp. NBAIMH1]